MATIQDVARQAQVGVATVSRVLSGNGYVKAETREKIQRAITDLNYTPNEMARNLYYQKTGIVAVIVPRLSHPFFAEFVNAAEAELCKKGYQTMICNTWSEKNYELRYLEMLERRKVDGVITGSHTLGEDEYNHVRRPIVALDRDLGPEIPCVTADHKIGGRMAAEALLRAGCRHVLQFRDAGESHSPYYRRHEVFAQIMEERGILCENCYTEWNSLSFEYYEGLTDRILEDHPGLDGIFATDVVAMNLMRHARELGIRIPEELRLVAYDGTGVARLPNLTMVCQPIRALARESVEMIHTLIQGQPLEQRLVTLPVNFHQGVST